MNEQLALITEAVLVYFVSLAGVAAALIVTVQS